MLFPIDTFIDKVNKLRQRPAGRAAYHAVLHQLFLGKRSHV